MSVIDGRDVFGVIHSSHQNIIVVYAYSFYGGLFATSYLLANPQVFIKSPGAFLRAEDVIIYSIIAANVIGALGGGIAWLVSNPDHLYRRIKPGLWRELSMFPEDMPPEVRRLRQKKFIENDTGLTRGAEISKVKLFPEKSPPPAFLRGFTARFDYGMNFYEARSKELGVWFGFSIERDIPIVSFDKPHVSLSLRPRVGIGLMYVLLEGVAKVGLGRGVYILGGVCTRACPIPSVGTIDTIMILWKRTGSGNRVFTLEASGSISRDRYWNFKSAVSWSLPFSRPFGVLLARALPNPRDRERMTLLPSHTEVGFNRAPQ